MLNRRDFLKIISAGTAVYSVSQHGLSAGNLPDDNKLNLLFLMTDQHHAQWLGCAGHPFVKTPNLDRLAAAGTRFTNAFAPVPYCSPTRLSIETGMYPASLGLGHNIDNMDDPLRLREPMRAYQHSLAAKGYHCYQLGKWHLGDPKELTCYFGNIEPKTIGKTMRDHIRAAGDKAYDEGPRQGETGKVGDVFLTAEVSAAHDMWLKEKHIPKQDVGIIGRSRLKPEYHYESVLADKCIELMRKHRDEPFAITYSVSPPHAPWVVPAPFYDMYDPAKLPLSATWNKQPEPWQDSASARMGRIYGEPGLREYLRCYTAQVTMMDWCIGRIIDELDALKLSERTLVIFTSDHGNMLGQHGMMDKTHGTFYDDLMRVPMLVRLPGVVPGGKTCDAFVASMDLPVTILDYLGADPLPKAHGRSLRGMVSGKEDDRDVVFGERNDPKSPRFGRMVRTRKWKLCLFSKGANELYDLEKDPDEVVNVYADPANAGIIENMRQKLRDHMVSTGDQADYSKLMA